MDPATPPSEAAAASPPPCRTTPPASCRHSPASSQFAKQPLSICPPGPPHGFGGAIPASPFDFNPTTFMPGIASPVTPAAFRFDSPLVSPATPSATLPDERVAGLSEALQRLHYSSPSSSPVTSADQFAQQQRWQQFHSPGSPLANEGPQELELPEFAVDGSSTAQWLPPGPRQPPTSAPAALNSGAGGGGADDVMSDMSSFVFSEFLGPSDADDAAAAPLPSFGDGLPARAFASNPYVSVPSASRDESVDPGEIAGGGMVAASKPFMQSLAGVPAPDSPLSPAFYLDLLGSPFPSPGLPSPGFPGGPESPVEGGFVGSMGFASQQPPYGLGVSFPMLGGATPGIGYLPPKPGASPEPAAQASPAFSSKAAPRSIAKGKLRGASAGPDGDYTGKIFACTVPGCGKPFKRAEHLKRHYKSVHTTEKPFQCPVETCRKKFSRSDNLNQHIRTHKDDSVQQLHVETQEFQAPVLQPVVDSPYLNMTPFNLTFDVNHTPI